MKRIMIAMVAALLSFGAAGAERCRCEVYLNVPGEKALHIEAEVEFKDYGIVSIHTDWGYVYITHIANVVIVRRKGGIPMRREN